MKKKPSITKLKKVLWKLIRQQVIKLHGNSCYTCYAQNLEGANLQVGHFIPSSVCSVEMRYCLDNLRPQCFRCNLHLSGNWLAYEAHLKRNGVDVEGLKRRNEQTKNAQYDILWYNNKIEHAKIV